MTEIKPGQSELDVLTVRIPDAGIEITDIESIKVSSNVLVPTDTFSFTVDIDDPTTTNLLTPGTRVEIAVNDRLCLTGYIDKKTINTGGRGTVCTIDGRDIMGGVVDSSVNPKLRFGETMTAADVFASVLNPFGIGTLYNDGSLNVNIQTGATQKPKLSTQQVTVQIPKQTLASDGTIATAYNSEPVKLVNGKNPSLKTVQLSALKPHEPEGAYSYMDRVAKRLGLRIYAAADGSGIIVDAPDFSQPPTHHLVHSLTDTNANNVIDGSCSFDLAGQPGCIVARAFGGLDASLDRKQNVVIVINELAGCDQNGQPLQAIKDILAQYKSARVVALRPQLKSFRSGYANALVARPLFLKDDESRNIDQLEGFARREMAQHQNKALHLKYTVEGLSQDSKPFAPNTMVSVKDDVFGIDTNMYVLEREFHKAREGGTITNLTLCLPYTIALQS